jgi:hypothetical protein
MGEMRAMAHPAQRNDERNHRMTYEEKGERATQGQTKLRVASIHRTTMLHLLQPSTFHGS